jgi:hypothetical protein
MLNIHFGIVQLIQHFSAIHYSPVGNGNILDTVVHQNIRLSVVIVSDIPDSEPLLVVLHVLYHVNVENLSEPVKKSIDSEWFQSLASDLISLIIKAIEPVWDFMCSLYSIGI